MSTEFQNITQGRVPAKATLEFMQRTETKFDNLEIMTNQITTEMAIMKKDIQQINEKLDCHTKKFDQLGEKIDKFLEGCDQKYAGKYIENWINWVLRIIVGAVLLALLGLVIIKNV